MRATRLAALAFERDQVGHDRIWIFMRLILPDCLTPSLDAPFNPHPRPGARVFFRVFQEIT